MPKLIDYQCLNCGHVEEGFEGEPRDCPDCIGSSAIMTGLGVEDNEIRIEMTPIFSPKNNQQRARVND